MVGFFSAAQFIVLQLHQKSSDCTNLDSGINTALCLLIFEVTFLLNGDLFVNLLIFDFLEVFQKILFFSYLLKKYIIIRYLMRGLCVF